MNKKGNTQNDDIWLVTFADLLALLLAFFILLYSMSVVNQKEWDDIADSLAKFLNPEEIYDESDFTSQLGIQSINIEQALDLDYLYTILTEKLESDEVLKNNVIITKMDDRIVISLASHNIFQIGSTEISQNAQVVLFAIGNVIQQIGNEIEINGHTDPSPIRGGQYSSNWELSLRRAMIIGEELKKYGHNYKINAYGLSSSRYDEIKSRKSISKNLYSLSRRIDIIIKEYSAKPIK